MPYSESELVLPALATLIERGRSSGMGTTELIAALRERLKPNGADLVILKGRNDDHFSQKVRNLVSHNTLVKKGLATYRKIAQQTVFVITDEGNSLGPALMGAIDRSRASTSQRVDGTARRHTPPR